MPKFRRREEKYAIPEHNPIFVNKTAVRDFANLPYVWHLQILPHAAGYSPSLITGLRNGRMAIAFHSIGK